MILQGAVNTNLTNSSGQLKMFDDSGNMTFDENGMMVLHREGQQIAFDFAADYADLGSVNLDDLDSLNWFHRTLIRMGVIDALKSAGAGEGDSVRIGETEFDFVE